MKLYHFLPAEFALQNLKHRRLKIAQFNDLNDPFELIAANHSDKDQRSIWRGWKKSQEAKWGVLCFCKAWTNPVMWSHYSDKHKGMCLGFEVDDDLLMPVNYTKERLDINIEELFDQGKLTSELINKMLRTKFADWKYEQEVRIFASLDEIDSDTGLYFSQFNEQVKLAEVIAGPLCVETEKDIRSCIQEDDSYVKIIKARLAFRTFDVIENKKSFMETS